jgi:addiction module HigA family antidote
MFTVLLENITDEFLANAHPGAALKLDYLPDLDITEYRFAKLFGITQTHLRQVLNGQRSVTASLALRLGKLFNQSPEMWLGLQSNFDLLKARREAGSALDEVTPIV